MIGSLPPAEMVLVLRYMIVLAIGAWAARPLALRLVPGGGGWVVAILLAWSFIGWFPWLISALGILPFPAVSLSGLVLLVAARLLLPAPSADSRGGLVAALSFATLFWFGLAQRLARADLLGLEKFTDMAFLAAAMRSDFMPPQDAWYAGATINYYYLGQAMTAAWGHIMGASPAATYQIAMAGLFGLTGLATWRLTVALVQPRGDSIGWVLGGAAALVTLYGGNFHSVLYTLFRDVMPTAKVDFYFPDSTRFIGFDPPAADKGFTEFTAYAFAAGDLHAHVVATPVFLLAMLVIVTIIRRGLSGAPPDTISLVVLGWILGLCMGINSWDVAILGMISLIAALLLVARQPSPMWQCLDQWGAAALVTVATAFLTAAPFMGSFVPFASGVELAPAHTPAWQLLAVYGHALPLVGLLLLGVWRLGDPQILSATLLVAALFLIALPEIVIMRDIYELEYARANTMFKLSFRAQQLIIIAGFAVLAPAVVRGGVWMMGAMIAAAPLMATLVYAAHIYSPPGLIRGLDGYGYLGDERELVEAVSQLDLALGESLVEASGEAFGETARASAMTGLPAVVGWAAHEWLWRGDGEAANARARHVELFYSTEDPVLRCRIVRRYNIRYAIVGQVERRRYPKLQGNAIAALGSEVYTGSGGSIVRIEPDICR
ncbi:DUF2298 domain-containing protein [Parahaliea mediterranea]|uniref:DUF2298 domain-containing protein n=1 Tax=Parahaliea mediterranea TaxID=651086 RepID=UPI000E2E7EB7|nr:DUF2298 domain-containing protein [Parahaliea mediterranea]